MNNIKKIIAEINRYYELTKIAIPLDDNQEDENKKDVILTPFAQFDKETRKEDATSIDFRARENMSQFLSSDQIRDLTESTALPPPVEFRRHYANTTLKYRLIFTGENSNTGTIASEGKYNISLSFEDFKKDIKFKLIYMEKVVASMPDSDREKNKKRKNEINNLILLGNYLLEHFDELFHKDAINIIINQYNENDRVTPQAIDHDIGHKLLEEDNSVYNFIYDKTADAILKDYCIRSPLPNKDKFSTHENNYSEKRGIDYGELQSEIYNQIIFAIIAINNPVAGSVSTSNLSKQKDHSTFTDSFTDLLMHYNRLGESFTNLKIHGADFYISQRTLSLSPKDDKYPEGKIMLTPRNDDGSIPNIKAALTGQDGVFKYLEGFIKSRLEQLVGKIFYLW